MRARGVGLVGYSHRATSAQRSSDFETVETLTNMALALGCYSTSSLLSFTNSGGLG